MFAWIDTNWDKIDEAVTKIIEFMREFLGQLGEWPLV